MTKEYGNQIIAILLANKSCQSNVATTDSELEEEEETGCSSHNNKPFNCFGNERWLLKGS